MDGEERLGAVLCAVLPRLRRRREGRARGQGRDVAGRLHRAVGLARPQQEDRDPRRRQAAATMPTRSCWPRPRDRSRPRPTAPSRATSTAPANASITSRPAAGTRRSRCRSARARAGSARSRTPKPPAAARPGDRPPAGVLGSRDCEIAERAVTDQTACDARAAATITRLERVACCSRSSLVGGLYRCSPISCCRRSGPITSTRRASPPADGDADRAGHSRRSDQCRAGRRRQGRALRDAGRRLVSRRSGDAAILDRDRRQRAAGPSLSRRAGQQSVSISAGARISRSKSRTATAPITAIMCGSGRRWTQGQEKRPVWLGAATFDRSVGVSHYTGAITHHIDADIDAERALLADRPRSRRHGRRQISGHRHRADHGRAQRRRRSLLHRRRGLDPAPGRGLPEATATRRRSSRARPRPRSRTRSGKRSPMRCGNRRRASRPTSVAAGSNSIDRSCRVRRDLRNSRCDDAHSSRIVSVRLNFPPFPHPFRQHTDKEQEQ